MSQWHRGAIPKHINSTTSAGVFEQWPIGGLTAQLSFSNVHAVEPIDVYFTPEARNAGAGNGYTVLAGESIQLDMEIDQFWTLSTNASQFQVLALCRNVNR